MSSHVLEGGSRGVGNALPEERVPQHVLSPDHRWRRPVPRVALGMARKCSGLRWLGQRGGVWGAKRKREVLFGNVVVKAKREKEGREG